MNPRRGGAVLAAGGFPAVAAIFLPKCPMCAAIYLGAFGRMLPDWTGFAAAIFAAVAIGARAWTKGRPFNGLVGIAAAAGIAVSRHAFTTPFPGIVFSLLLIGSFLILERPWKQPSPRLRLRPCCR